MSGRGQPHRRCKGDRDENALRSPLPTPTTSIASSTQSYGGPNLLDRVSDCSGQIANFLTGGHRSYAAYAFAKLGKSQQDLVVQSLNGSVCFAPPKDLCVGWENIEQFWMSVTKGHVKRVAMDSRLTPELRKNACKNIEDGMVEDVTVPVFRPFLQSVSKNGNIKKLKLVFHKSFRAKSILPYLTGAPAINIRDVTVVNLRENACPFRNGDVTPARIAHKFPGLLHLKCVCPCEECQSDEISNPIWEVLDLLAIGEVSYDCKVPARLETQVANGSEVKVNVRNISSHYHEAVSRLHRNIVGLDLYDLYPVLGLEAMDVWRLSTLKKVKKLRIRIDSTAFTMLKEGLENMVDLEVLEIISKNACFPIRAHPNEMYGAIHDKKKLKVLSLKHVNISGGEIGRLMRKMEFLEEFTFWGESRGEKDVDIARYLLETAWYHNSHLKSFQYNGGDGWVIVNDEEMVPIWERLDRIDGMVIRDILICLIVLLRLRNGELSIVLPDRLNYLWEKKDPWYFKSEEDTI